MFHPLIRLLATQPQLLAHHLGCYADLAALQAGQAAQQLRRRAVLGLAAVLALLLALLLGGTALLLLAVVPVADMPAPWLLAAAPGVPALAAAVLGWQARRQPWSWSLDLLREQVAADVALISQAGQA